MSEKHWWAGKKPIHEYGDGQECRLTYSRKVEGVWEYVIVTTFDDGTLIQSTTLKGGKAHTEDLR